MLKFGRFGLLLAAITTSAAAVTVETASGDWSKLPQLSQRGYEHLSEKMQAKLYEIAESKSCPAFGLDQGRLNFRMGFATRYDADGTLSRLIVPKLDCPEAESVAGGAILEMIQAGDYAPSGQSRNGWYQGTLGFNFASQTARDPAVVKTAAQPGAVKGPNPAEVVCEKVERIGTRLVSDRVCMTRAQWAEQKRQNREEIDHVQMQRNCGPAGTAC
jgi:hypothetical protein